MTDRNSRNSAAPNPLPRKSNPVDAKVGKILKLRRQMVGLTQADLGERSGLSAQQIHKYESGQSCMAAARLVQMAAILEVPISFFFDTIEDHPEAPNDLLEMLSDPACLEVMLALRAVPSTSERHRIVDLVRVIVDHERARASTSVASEASVTYLAQHRTARD